MSNDAPPVFEPAPRARKERRQLAAFVVTGGVAAVINILSRWLLSQAVFYELAVTIAYGIGMSAAFLLSRAFVFGSAGGHWLGEYYRFALVNVASFLIVLAVSIGFARLLFPAIGFHWHAEDIAHVIGVMSPILFSFYAHKHFSFRARTSAP